MARIELRDCTIRFKDGLSGTAVISATAPTSGATSMSVDTIVLNTPDTDLIPIGARFTVAGETASQTHVVLTRTPTSTSPTTSITFSPALGAGTRGCHRSKSIASWPLSWRPIASMRPS